MALRGVPRDAGVVEERVDPVQRGTRMAVGFLCLRALSLRRAEQRQGRVLPYSEGMRRVQRFRTRDGAHERQRHIWDGRGARLLARRDSRHRKRSCRRPKGPARRRLLRNERSLRRHCWDRIESAAALPATRGAVVMHRLGVRGHRLGRAVASCGWSATSWGRSTTSSTS